MKRSSAGSVSYRNSNGRLQLVVRHKGKRHFLSTGLPYTEINIKGQASVIAEMEKAIAFDSFEEWIQERNSKKSKATSQSLSLLSLWDSYIENKIKEGYRGKAVSESTVKRDYSKIRNRLLKLPDTLTNHTKANDIQEYLLKHFSKEVTRRTLVQLNACCTWAKSSKLIDVNYFSELRFPARSSKTDTTSYRAFSGKEINEILNNISNSHYKHFISILTYTGMRPEELVTLTWTDITDNKILINKARPSDTGIKGNTKTSKVRYFPINNQLKILLELSYRDRRDSDLVTPSIKGTYINYANLNRRYWKPLLTKLEEEGKIQKYLPLYNLRHTFITRSLEKGIDIATVAYWVGNSPETIMKHYASRSASASVPEF